MTNNCATERCRSILEDEDIVVVDSDGEDDSGEDEDVEENRNDVVEAFDIVGADPPPPPPWIAPTEMLFIIAVVFEEAGRADK